MEKSDNGAHWWGCYINMSTGLALSVERLMKNETRTYRESENWSFLRTDVSNNHGGGGMGDSFSLGLSFSSGNRHH